MKLFPQRYPTPIPMLLVTTLLLLFITLTWHLLLFNPIFPRCSVHSTKILPSSLSFSAKRTKLILKLFFSLHNLYSIVNEISTDYNLCFQYSELSNTTYPTISKTVFAIFMVLVPILLLNMLIAMMGNTYAHVIEQSEKEWMKQVRTIPLVYSITVEPCKSRFNRTALGLSYWKFRLNKSDH